MHSAAHKDAGLRCSIFTMTWMLRIYEKKDNDGDDEAADGSWHCNKELRWRWNK